MHGNSAGRRRCGFGEAALCTRADDKTTEKVKVKSGSSESVWRKQKYETANFLSTKPWWSSLSTAGRKLVRYRVNEASIFLLSLPPYATYKSPIMPLIFPLKFCVTFQFFISPLGITAVPRENGNNAYAKLWRANKVHYDMGDVQVTYLKWDWCILFMRS